MSGILQTVSCLDGYDPEALRVDKAREAIRACLSPVTKMEKLPVREALGRILATDVLSRVDLPAFDNSAI